jgi:2Fe-2S ferredoxin
MIEAVMVNIIFETPEGARTELDVKPEGSLMEAAREHCIAGILADCGGSMVCGTCHVVIDPEWQSKLPPQSEMEREMLEYVPEPQPNTRLTCQIPVTEELDGLVMRIPTTQR